ncbi:MAG TPA: 4Fe-4S dicluster domain-containing protein [Anaeromyxobacteraceae bacterium]|nr:4Fe-4S dicluster domain-containing protein [Anaeromyxobacteraceae bacterium]
MVRIEIHAEACRGCELCVDVCPTEVLAMEGRKAFAKTAEDCIACLSCKYLCPSGAIGLSEFHAVKNFYRDLDFSRRMGRFL